MKPSFFLLFSMVITCEASSRPSRAPTFAPSRKPTTSPSSTPTKFPSQLPTNKPSMLPTAKPSIRPTTFRPTPNPSQIPTRIPTKLPTTAPSIKPSMAPSSKPSSSSGPSRNPTMTPSTPITSNKPTSSKISISITTASRISAPYIDATDWPPFDMVSCATSTGQLFFTLAFIVSNNKAPSWGGYYSLADKWFLDKVTQLRAMGGDVIVSFGGAAGLELAQTITSLSDLVSAYQSVVDAYTLKAVDFDVEGSAIADTASVDRRNKAIRQLQINNPNLIVHYTLPVMPTGLDSDGINLIKNALANGVRIDVCNIMTMDYGSGVTKMGEAAIQAAQATKKQLETAGYGTTKLGITPMIGVNDVVSEVFQLTDASSVVSFAWSVDWVSRLSFWSSNRDHIDSTASPGSGITQDLYAFTRIFGTYLASASGSLSLAPSSAPVRSMTPSRTPSATPNRPSTKKPSAVPSSTPTSMSPSRVPSSVPSSSSPTMQPIPAPVEISQQCGASAFWCDSAPYPQQPMISGCLCCCYWGFTPRGDGSCSCKA